MTGHSPPQRHRRRRWGWPHLLLVAALVLGLAVATSLVAVMTRMGNETPVAPGAPRSSGYFTTLPAGAWDRLPSEATCSARVRRSSWEPRPSNDGPNHTVPDRAAIAHALKVRPRGASGTYDPHWDGWLLQRVSGAHRGTTDEIIQWAACKWGIADNVLRAMAAAESTWYEHLIDPQTGRCVEQRGCGDTLATASAASRVFCREISSYGHDYTADSGDAGICPKTFSMMGVMAWEDPAWGPMQANQNGTFPFSRDSTAFAVDYAAAFLRGCQEGWIRWLSTTGNYRPGDLWGCVGVWFAGTWTGADHDDYVKRVRALLDQRIWLRADFAEPVHAGSGS